MSWDLLLVPREHAGDAQDWSEAMLDEEADTATAHRHAEAILRRRPKLEAAASRGAVQLLAPDSSGLPITVDLDGYSATINVSYWDPGERAGELADLVVDIVEATQEAAGFVAFDPQQGRVVSPASSAALSSAVTPKESRSRSGSPRRPAFS